TSTCDLTPCLALSSFFFANTATPEIYTLSLHDALPISEYECNPCQHIIVRYGQQDRQCCNCCEGIQHQYRCMPEYPIQHYSQENDCDESTETVEAQQIDGG